MRLWILLGLAGLVLLAGCKGADETERKVSIQWAIDNLNRTDCTSYFDEDGIKDKCRTIENSRCSLPYSNIKEAFQKEEARVFEFASKCEVIIYNSGKNYFPMELVDFK